jgi:hypothetical protein
MDELVQRFQSFWFGENITQYQRLAMKSFVDFGHRYILYAYRKFDVPAGVELRDAAELLPEARVFFYGDKAGVGRGSVSGSATSSGTTCCTGWEAGGWTRMSFVCRQRCRRKTSSWAGSTKTSSARRS